MMGFRSSHKVLREAVGAYVNGVWTPGARSVTSVTASAQPVTSARDMLMPLPEGRHMSDYRKFYTDTRLQTSADGERVQPDIVVSDGYGYELVGYDPHQSNVINHYKFIGVRVFKFTTDNGWTSGTLKRA